MRERGHLESRGTLHCISASFQDGLGQGIPTLQMLDKIQALKVSMYINTHVFPLRHCLVLIFSIA
jgi:hypothetical protein